MSPPESQWIAFHIHYHGDQNLLLNVLMRPLLRDLLGQGRTDSFFFVRYALGGPHVRLRLRVPADQNETVTEGVLATVSRFFQKHPSRNSLSRESIEVLNKAILSQDPNEHHEAVYPDNSVHLADFKPETERYGGTKLLPASLDFFALSSARSLELIARQESRAEERKLTSALLLLIRYALGFSVDQEDFSSLVQYAVQDEEVVPAVLAKRAKEAFISQRESLFRLLGREIRDTPSPPPISDMVLARCFAREVATAHPRVRHRILTSQLHMTANRFGLKNAEEVYICSLLGQALHEFAQENRSGWSSLWQGLADRSDCEPNARGSLGTWLRPAFDRLFSF